MNKFNDFWQKIKKVKHIEIWLAVLIGIVVCIAYFCFFMPKSDKNIDDSQQPISSTMEYVDRLENKLCNVISKIDGVGQVSVAITLESGFRYEYATDTETKTTVSGDVQTTIKTETVIMVDNQPVVIRELYPVIKGVIIVAEGAQDFAIKMEILTAIENFLEIDTNNITILN